MMARLPPVALWLVAAIGAQPADYATDIAPLFKKRCLGCHGPGLQRSGLRVDRRASLLKGGDLGSPAVVPGHPEKSLLVALLREADKKQRMPLGNPPLPEEEIRRIESWIQQGAVWPGQMEEVPEEAAKPALWSLQPVRKPEVPAGSGSPVDDFLRRALAAKGLNYNPPAEPRALIRRASIVLTGLPPSPEETGRFLEAWKTDPEKAFRNLVDDLLASAHFGERWAQHWLDAVRWAESSGSESNYYRKNAWPYRDYVIRAFQEDRPYNRFLRDQIAGDATGEDAATGFLVAGPYVPGETVGQELSAQKQARADRLDEIVQTVGAAVMGVTIGCARCHNHKFDPISIRDYYSMTAVFQDVEFDHRAPKLPPDHPRAAAGRRIAEEIAEVRGELARLGSWEERWPDHRKVHFAPAVTKRVRVTFLTDQIRLDELELYSSPASLENLALASRGTRVRTNKKAENPAKPAEFLIDDRRTGFWAWDAKPGECEGHPQITLELAAPSEVGRIDFSSDRFPHYGTDYVEGYRLSVPTAGIRVEVEQNGRWIEAAATGSGLKAPADLQARINELAARYDAEGPQPIFAGRFVPPEKTFVLHRGSPMDPREEVPPAGLAVLDGKLNLDSRTPGQARRLAFSGWLTSPSHPLTARVMVNRLWHHVFGQGLVTTPADFGEAGGRPSHPELLDWLAATFVEEEWSVKRMLRRLVLSEAFRQSSAPRADALASDSGSRLLWRFPPRRLDAEVIRDGMLAGAGTLDRTVGGPGYRIHNVKKRFEQWTVVDNAAPHTWRRLLYQERMRGIDDRMFTAFDLPDCGQILGKRPVSTTPLQALNLMNGPLVAVQSVKLAERARGEAGGDASAQIARMFELVLSRPPSPQELEWSLSTAASGGMAAVARALFNSNEAAFLP